jgi:hypothetical protein
MKTCTSSSQKLKAHAFNNPITPPLAAIYAFHIPYKDRPVDKSSHSVSSPRSQCVSLTVLCMHCVTCALFLVFMFDYSDALSTNLLLGPLLQIDEEGRLTKSPHMEHRLALAKIARCWDNAQRH